MDEDEDQEAADVSQDVPFAAFDLLASVKARYSATLAALNSVSVVFTDWLSITPALGEASRPSISRRFITSTVLMASNRPASR